MLTLDEIKNLEHNILKYIVGICEEYNLRYYLSYGTLLGAIRHKGFIPWDDDIDISMPRKDYDMFISITTKCPDTRYKVVHPSLPDYPFHFVKVTDSFTRVKNEDVGEFANAGVWVDVFPLDGTPSNKPTIQKRAIHLLQMCRSASAHKSYPENYHNLYLLWRITRLIGNSFFKKLEVRLSRLYDFDNSSYCGFMSEILPYCFPRHIFNESTKVLFEGEYYNAPAGYDEYLTILYNDYMSLPKETERVTHCIEAEYIQTKE